MFLLKFSQKSTQQNNIEWTRYRLVLGCRFAKSTKLTPPSWLNIGRFVLFLLVCFVFPLVFIGLDSASTRKNAKKN